MSLDPFFPSETDDFNIHVNEDMQPPFSRWIKERLDAIYAAQTEKQFKEGFDKLFAGNTTNLSIQGKDLCRDQFKQKLWESIKSSPAEVEVKSIDKTPDGGESKLTGEGKVTFVAAKGTHALQIQLIQDDSLEPPPIPMSGRPGFIDRRRAVRAVLD